MTMRYFAKSFGDLGPRYTIHSFESKKDRDSFVDKTVGAFAITAKDAQGPWRGRPVPHRIHHPRQA
jgi:hypothetical protein